ncbi:MAG: RluA family pseudouridine synthase [Clostridia bacterium]|nr:RluA family pseudouridine synthase [Clostridia bacterium]
MDEFTVNIQGIRLDDFILSQHHEFTNITLYKFLKANRIKVNGRKVPLNTRLDKGDTVRLYMPSNDGPKYLRAREELDIVYEDDSVLIIDKPAGIIIETPDDSVIDTLVNRVKLRHVKAGGEESSAPRLCHRLDTGTSGLVIFAKTKEAEDAMTELMKRKQLNKEYLTITFGRPSKSEAQLINYIVKYPEQSKVRVYDKIVDGAKQAVLDYSVVEHSGRLSLLRVHLVTGRTHQIRAQLAYIGCPVLGDGKYGNNVANREYKFKYQALCAYRLTFPKSVPQVLKGVSGKTFCGKLPWYVNQFNNKELK